MRPSDVNNGRHEKASPVEHEAWSPGGVAASEWRRREIAKSRANSPAITDNFTLPLLLSLTIST